MKKGYGQSLMEGGEGEAAAGGVGCVGVGRNPKQKPPFRLVKDDTKPFLRDPILRPDPIETEQAVLRLPPFPFPTPRPSCN